MGDYKINPLNYKKHSGITDFVYLLYTNAFTSLLNRPTRVNMESATVIANTDC